MMKCDREGSDQYEALMEQRNTPRQDTGLSPTQMMFGRTTRTLLPEVVRNKPEINEKRERRRSSVKRHYDKSARNYPELKVDQAVYFERKSGSRWILGKVVNRTNTHTYVVQSQDGVFYRRNRLHIRPTNIEVIVRDKSPARCDSRDQQKLCVPQPTRKGAIVSRPTEAPKSVARDEPVVQDNCDSDTTNNAEPLNSDATSKPNDVTVPNAQTDIPIALRKEPRMRRPPTKLKDFITY